MYRIIAIVIGIAFLGNGLLLLAVGSAMFGQAIGILEIEALNEALHIVGEWDKNKADKQLIPMTLVGYFGYLALAGLTLSLGAIGSLTNRRIGLPTIGVFLLMYATLFINSQTINPGIVLLAVFSVLFLFLLWIKRCRHA